jgi:ABC-type branched-subunit amino acid transport system permease subunit
MDLLVFGGLIVLISVVQPGGIMALAQRGRRRTG